LPILKTQLVEEICLNKVYATLSYMTADGNKDFVPQTICRSTRPQDTHAHYTSASWEVVEGQSSTGSSPWNGYRSHTRPDVSLFPRHIPSYTLPMVWQPTCGKRETPFKPI